jgi:hypothetical protein
MQGVRSIISLSRTVLESDVTTETKCALAAIPGAQDREKETGFLMLLTTRNKQYYFATQGDFWLNLTHVMCVER